ncbi:MAG: MraY family glycosyltransferase [Bacteroidales bacterium]
MIPRIVFISQSKKLFDIPNERSSHNRVIPRLGGVSFFPSMIFAFAFVLGLRLLAGYEINPYFGHQLLVEGIFLLCGLMIMFTIGVADDLVGVSFSKKFCAQTLASLLLIAGGIYVNSFHGLFGLMEMPQALGYFVTVILVVLVINAINLIDGIDGLASGLSAIALFCLTCWFSYHGIYAYAMLAAALLGAVVPFFIYNVFGGKHKLFMGDTGSLLIGFLLAFLSAKFCMLNVPGESGSYGVDGAPVLILAILFVPIFDLIRVFAYRIHQGRSPFLPDRNHVHHLFLDIGFSHKRTMVSLVAFALIFAGFNFVILPFLGPTLLLIADFCIGIVLFRVLRYRHKQKIKDFFQKENISTNKRAV